MTNFEIVATCPVCGSTEFSTHLSTKDFTLTGEEFSIVGAVRTPQEYFINIINGIRKIHGQGVSAEFGRFTDERWCRVEPPFCKIRELS